MLHDCYHFIEQDLVMSLQELESRYHATDVKHKNSGSQVTPKQKKSPLITKKEFLDSHDRWIKQKANDLNIPQFQEYLGV